MTEALRRQAIRWILGGTALALAAGAGAADPAASASTAGSAGGTPSSSASAQASAAAQLKKLNFGVRLVDVPVDEANNPRAFRYIIDVLPVNTVIRRRITIFNYEPRPAHFDVYPSAATISGGMFLVATGRTGNELTGWITVQHPSVTIGAKKSVTDLVTIHVPRGATGGEHYGVIWAQQTGPSPSGSSGSVGITVVGRVGIRVYLGVGQGGLLPTSFAITSVTAQRTTSGQPVLLARVSDTGGQAIDLSGQLRLSHGPGGTSAGPFAEQQGVTLAPGQSGTLTFAPPKSLPDGPWTAAVTMVSGITTVSKQATVTFGPSLAALSSASWVSAPVLAWGGGLLLSLVVIGGTLVTRMMRVRRRAAT